MEAFNISRIEYLDHLIRTKSTGSPKQLAKKLNISERSLYYHLQLIKEMGAPVKFCKTRNSYYYVFDGRINIGFLAQDN